MNAMLAAYTALGAAIILDGAWLAQHFGVAIPERKSMHEALTKSTFSAGKRG